MCTSFTDINTNPTNKKHINAQLNTRILNYLRLCRFCAGSGRWPDAPLPEAPTELDAEATSGGGSGSWDSKPACSQALRNTASSSTEGNVLFKNAVSTLLQTSL